MERRRKNIQQLRQRARQEGHVALSHDLAMSVTMFCSAALVFYFAPALLNSLVRLIQSQWSNVVRSGDDFPGTVNVDAIWEVAFLLISLVVAFGCIAIASRLFQIGCLFLPHRAIPDLQRVNPVSGTQRIFASSPEAICFSAAKLLLVAFATWQFARTMGLAFDAIPTMSVFQIWLVSMNLLGTFVLVICAAILLIGIFDVGWRRSKLERSLCDASMDRKRSIRAISTSLKAKK